MFIFHKEEFLRAKLLFTKTRHGYDGILSFYVIYLFYFIDFCLLCLFLTNQLCFLLYNTIRHSFVISIPMTDALISKLRTVKLIMSFKQSTFITKI